jgi:hypothetical protein
MLGECGWADHEREGQDSEEFHCISPGGFDWQKCFAVARFQLANA